MHNIQKIAKAALTKILASKKEPTPEIYAEAFYFEAKLQGILIEGAEEYNLDRFMKMCDEDILELLGNKQIKSKDDFLIFLIKTLNHIFFFKKNFALQLELAKFFLRILSTYPKKEIRSLAKGQLLELNHLNAQSMQIWRERWSEVLKQFRDDEIADETLHLLLDFDIQEPSFVQWQTEIKTLLENKKVSKERLGLVVGRLEQVINNLIQSKPQTKESKEVQKAPPTPPKKQVQFDDFEVLPIDFATTLISKEGMDQALHFAEERFVEDELNYSVIVFGIANFDGLITNYGNDAGKKVLAILGRLLKKYSNQTDLIAIYGKEEFLACLLNKDQDEALEFITHIDSIVQKSVFMYHEIRISIKLSAQRSSRISQKSLEAMLHMTLEEFMKHKNTQGIIEYG